MTETVDVNPAKHTQALERGAFEWKGMLASSARSQPLFSLYLAMHMSRTNETAHWQDDTDDTDNVVRQLEALNHYRRNEFQISTKATNSCRKQSDLRHEGQLSAAWLHECMHPNPIHYRDDVEYIDDEVKVNCRLATQWDFENKPDTQPLPTDATLLADIVGASQTML